MEGASLDDVTLAAAAPDFAYRMRLVAEGPLVPQGDAGYSVKSAEGQASWYYSQPFYRAEGVLTLPEGDVAVTRHRLARPGVVVPAAGARRRVDGTGSR